MSETPMTDSLAGLVKKWRTEGHPPMEDWEARLGCARELEAALIPHLTVLARARLDEASRWHQFTEGHDDDGWCCKRESELRDELMALEYAAPSGQPVAPKETK